MDQVGHEQTWMRAQVGRGCRSAVKIGALWTQVDDNVVGRGRRLAIGHGAG